jgi:uncharacterized protein (DUF2267 family)
VQYEELIDMVQMRLRLRSAADAERAMIATLSALSEFTSPEATRELGSHLPAELAEALDHSTPEEASWEEFTEIVAEKEGVGVIAEQAAERAIGVMKIVREAYGAGPEGAEDGLARVREELGEEFEPLFSWEF